GRLEGAWGGGGGAGSRGCGSQLHPRADPGITPPATKGWPWSGHRGTRKREKPVARWTGAFPSWRLLWRATPPHFWGNGKRDGQTPCTTKTGDGMALAMRCDLPTREDLMWRRALNIDRHPEVRRRRHRKSAWPTCALLNPIPAKAGIGGRRPGCGRTSGPHPSRLASLAPQSL